MVVCLIQETKTSITLLKSSSKLAQSLEKEFCVACIASSDKNFEDKKSATRYSLSESGIENCSISQLADYKEIYTFCEDNEVSFLFIQLTENKSRKIQQLLNACRELRIPYILFKDSFGQLRTEKILLPVNFLEEEVEKAQFASTFGRFCKSEITILQANDYGTKASKNTARMKELFDKFALNIRIEKATGDSFKVDKEALNKAVEINAGLIIITASRDYGLDDILFGPKEQDLIKKSNVPLLIVNPRGDLYALCD